MNVLVSMLTAVAQFLVGPFGIALIVVAVAGSFLAAMFRLCSPLTGFVCMGLGAAALSAAYMVNTFLGGGGGGLGI